MSTGKKRLLYSILFLLAVAGVIALILVKGPLSPVRVTTEPVRKGDLHPSRFGVGTVAARRSYDIGPNRSGRLLDLSVDHGDTVREGQVLGKMDPVDLADRLRSANKAVQKVENVIEASRARLAEIKARRKLATDDAHRHRELGRRKQTSRSQVEAKDTEALALADQYRGAQADLEATLQDLERARADRDAIQAQIDDLRLVSPVDGLVVARKVEPGSVVVSGSPVLQIVDPVTLWVRTRIDQKSGSGLENGLEAEILLRNKPDTPIKGKVARLELIADSLTEERWVDVTFQRIPEGIALGSLANVTIRLPVVENASWIPTAALHHRQGVPGVWMLEEGRARFREIGVGTRTLDGRVEVRSGLDVSDEVIVYSARALQEGTRLRAEKG